MPVNFLITDLSSGKKVVAIIIDNDGSHSLTIGDDIIMTQVEPSNTTVRTWEIHYQGPMNPAIAPVYPQAGDKFMIYTVKPFADGDYFGFKTKAMSVNNSTANKALSKISVVPNPYIATASWEPRSLYPTGRGTRQISFTNLPAKCTIRIYTVAGALVKTLHKDNTNLDNGGAITWDLVSDDGMDIAYGLYLFHVDAPSIGSYIGKFAIIK